MDNEVITPPGETEEPVTKLPKPSRVEIPDAGLVQDYLREKGYSILGVSVKADGSVEVLSDGTNNERQLAVDLEAYETQPTAREVATTSLQDAIAAIALIEKKSPQDDAILAMCELLQIGL